MASHCDCYSNLPHLQEDLPELCSHLHQRVQVATVRSHTKGLEVVWLKFLLFPAAAETQHKLLREEELEKGNGVRSLQAFHY